MEKSAIQSLLHGVRVDDCGQVSFQSLVFPLMLLRLVSLPQTTRLH